MFSSIYGINVWCKSLGRVTSKVENLVFYKHEARSFVRRGFRRKVPFFLSSTKLSEVVQDIAFDALAPDCSIQVLPICLSHCLSKVCVPAKVELFYLGFLPSGFTDSPRLWATFCRLSLRRFSGTCCLEAPFQALQQSARQAVLAHSMM